MCDIRLMAVVAKSGASSDEKGPHVACWLGGHRGHEKGSIDEASNTLQALPTFILAFSFGCLKAQPMLKVRKPPALHGGNCNCSEQN